MSATNPYFTIVLPTFNRASFLPKAIKSVINQQFTDWELIIVDDGSTDNTKEVVQQFMDADKRITYLYQENAERSAARNNGIKHAEGDYVCFLDSDDRYHTTHLQNFVDLIEEKENKIALYFSGVSLNKYDSKPFEYNEDYQIHQEFVLLNTLATPRACVSREIVLKEKFNPSIRIGEDKELWVRITEKFPVFSHQKNSIIQIEHDKRSILGKSVYDSLKTLNYILAKHKVSKKIAKHLRSNAYFNIAKYELAQQNRLNSIQYMLRSLLADITHQQSKLKLNVLIKLFSFQRTEKILEII